VFVLFLFFFLVFVFVDGLRVLLLVELLFFLLDLLVEFVEGLVVVRVERRGLNPRARRARTRGVDRDGRGVALPERVLGVLLRLGLHRGPFLARDHDLARDRAL